MKYTQEKLQQRIIEAFDNSGVFYRDTTLSNEILDMYQAGTIFQEPAFCDATFKRGGMLAPHRYQIVSSSARSLGELSANPQWGLCVLQHGCYFKVIDKTRIGKYVQITLLEIPQDLLPYFRTNMFISIEKDLASQGIDDFKEAVNLPAPDELNNRDWLDRLIDPLGINDKLEFINKLV